MPDYDRTAPEPLVGQVPVATPDEKERAAIHAAAQLAKGAATEDEFVESLRMLGVYDEARDMARRHQRERARTASAHAEKVLAIRSPRNNRRRRAS